MTFPICSFFLLDQYISSLPPFVFEIWQHIRLDNVWLPLRDSTITQSYFIPVPLSALVWTLAAAYCKFSAIDSIAPTPHKRYSQLSS